MDHSGVPHGKYRKSSGADPLTNTEFYDIYLWASSKDTDHFRKMKDCFHSNGWKMTSCFDHKLGELETQSIEDALLKCSHMVCLITKDDCKTNNIKQLMTIEMAIHSLPSTTGKGLEGRVIPIRCDVPESSLPPKLRALTGASIDDRDLEERLWKSINKNIRIKREENIRNVTDFSVSQLGRDVKGNQRSVNMSSSRPNTTEGYEQKQRELDEMRKKLDEKRAMLEETKQRHKKVESKLNAFSNSSSKHLQTIKDDIQEILGNTQLDLKIRERENVKLINEINKEADEKIIAINKMRKEKIEAYKIEIELERKIIKAKEAKLPSCLSDTDEFSKKVSEKIMDLTSKIQHAIKNIELTITRISQHDETLVNEAQVLASIDEKLSLNVHQDVSDCLHRIESEVERVEFVEGVVGGEYYGRIDGFIGKWELDKSIHIPSDVNDPRVCGLVSEDEICVRDMRNKDMYVTNINTQHTEKVIDKGGWIKSCAPIDSNVIICGKSTHYRDFELIDGYITLYDRHWMVIRNISIPIDGNNIHVNVDVDRDGLIIAAQESLSNIYVINPANDKIVNTIMMHAKKVLGGIQALSSGDIVVETGKKCTVISRSGEEKAVIHCGKWGSPCRVDKLTDTLYIAYWDEAQKTIAVDQVSRDGIIQARRIVEYEKSYHPLDKSPCLVTPSGNLVGCDGEKLLIYKKAIIL